VYEYAVGTFPSHSLWVKELKAGWQQARKVGPGGRS